MSDWDKRRQLLEANLVIAALDLFGHTGSHAFKIPISNTTPPLFVTCGEDKQFFGPIHSQSSSRQVEHVCGLQGFGQEGDRCPACEEHRRG